MNERRCFVIGDVHGHVDRLIALLEKAGIISSASAPGFSMDPDRPEIIQLGDLGHFGFETQDGDIACYHLAAEMGFTVLWGNHDYATKGDPYMGFRGYYPNTDRALRELIAAVNPQFAAARHGHLLTHAGLHPLFYKPRAHAEEMADILNRSEELPAVRDISWCRGGSESQGGILWRDDREDLAPLAQVYGHTRGYVRAHGNSLCIDTGDRKGHSLTGLWLPEMKLVSVGEDYDINELLPPEIEDAPLIDEDLHEKFYGKPSWCTCHGDHTCEGHRA